MVDVREILVSTIEERRPLVLLLGEDAWAESDQGDQILALAMNRVKQEDQASPNWSKTLATEPLPEEHYSWLAERFERRVHPAHIQALADLPWSAIFTTSIDPSLVRLFSTKGRSVETVLAAAEHASAARSTRRTPLYYLLSRAGEQNPGAQPPVDRRQLLTRRSQHALPLLDRIRETATPVGTIVVDGFDSGDGWLRFEDLIGTLGTASRNQVLWFGGTPNLDDEEEESFLALQREGRLLVEGNRLGSVIAELRAIGRLADIIPFEPEEVGTVSFGGNSKLDVPPDLSLAVEAVASIVDDSWSTFLPPLGQDALYDAFRRFHGNLGGIRQLVEGIRRGLSIEREFERDLQNTVFSAVADHSRFDSPIIVEGQSGTGKSVALARVALKVRERRSAAVLYSRGRIPQPHEVSDFCQEAERANARATLLVCDANANVDSYDELLSGLRSRGRRVVVLGSQYRSNNAETQGQISRLEAPHSLSEKEKEELVSLLREFGLGDQGQIDGEHFLAVLYRYLPPSRPQIATGLGREASAVVRTLEERATKPEPVKVVTELHQKLIESGIVSESEPLWLADSPALEQDEDKLAASRIINMIMAAGKLDCPVPLNLLLRAITARTPRFDSSIVAGLFGDLDLIRWKSRDTEGTDWEVSPRLRLEAELICQRRLGGPLDEAAVLLEMISAIRLGLDDQQERRFLLSLLQQIDRGGSYGTRYRESYVAFAQALTELREKFNVIDASLLLQESVFRRSAVQQTSLEPAQRLGLLEEARSAVQLALDAMDNGQILSNRRSKQNLLVERATVYGFLARTRAEITASPEETWSAYQAARVAVRQAVSTADDYHPHDVALWTPADLFDRGSLTDEQRAELAADIYSALNQVEEDALPPSQMENFQRRRMRVGQSLQNYDLTEDAYLKLEEQGSTAGYFLRAQQMAPDLDDDTLDLSDPLVLNAARQAATYLTDLFKRIQSDDRCLWLLLECMWIHMLRRRPLHGERQPLPAGDSLAKLLDVVRALNEAAGQSSRYGTRYLEAVLTWVAGEYGMAQDIFRRLFIDTDNVYRGRIVVRHVMSDESGTPRLFSGRVEQRVGEGRWRIRVGDLNQTVGLLERDFQRRSVDQGRTITGFTIGFNFIGPIAEPIRRRDELS